MVRAGSELVEEWIEQQLAAGKTREELHDTMFVYGSSVYKIKKAGKKDKFNLQAWVGCVVLKNE